jgi:hypothetical protein
MPVSIQATARTLNIEDLDTTTSPTVQTVTKTVLGLGSTVLTKVDMVRFTHFVVADNDVQAAAGGVAIGEIYCTNASKLRTRLA